MSLSDESFNHNSVPTKESILFALDNISKDYKVAEQVRSVEVPFNATVRPFEYFTAEELAFSLPYRDKLSYGVVKELSVNFVDTNLGVNAELYLSLKVLTPNAIRYLTDQTAGVFNPYTETLNLNINPLGIYGNSNLVFININPLNISLGLIESFEDTGNREIEYFINSRNLRFLMSFVDLSNNYRWEPSTVEILERDGSLIIDANDCSVFDDQLDSKVPFYTTDFFFPLDKLENVQLTATFDE